MHIGTSLAYSSVTAHKSPDNHGDESTPGSFAMYLLLAAPAVSLVTILTMTLHSQFASRPNL